MLDCVYVVMDGDGTFALVRRRVYPHREDIRQELGLTWEQVTVAYYLELHRLAKQAKPDRDEHTIVDGLQQFGG